MSCICLPQPSTPLCVNCGPLWTSAWALSAYCVHILWELLSIVWALCAHCVHYCIHILWEFEALCGHCVHIVCILCTYFMRIWSIVWTLCTHCVHIVWALYESSLSITCIFSCIFCEYCMYNLMHIVWALCTYSSLLFCNNTKQKVNVNL